jgi:voltage-gated potassium channel
MNEESSAQDPKPGHDAAGRRSTVYNLFILALILFSWVIMAGVLLGPHPDEVVWRADFFVCAILFADFCRNLWRAPSRADYFFKTGGWLDVLGSVPAVPGFPLTSLLHLARLNQVLRIARHLRGKDREDVLEETRREPARTALLTITIAALVLVTIASLLILWLEQDAPRAQIQNGADAFWWAVVTVTSVGYGDYVPVTLAGRILAILIMTFGIGVFAVLTSFVAAKLVGLQSEQDNMIETIREENAAIRAELAEVKELLQQQREDWRSSVASTAGSEAGIGSLPGQENERE